MNSERLKIIKARRGLIAIDLKELWEYRELFWFLAIRDLLIRYKQAVFGIFWVIIQPVITMLLFSIIFGRLAKLPSDGIPYPVFIFAALLPWQFFSNAIKRSTDSVVAEEHIITKVYFPRLILPTNTAIAGFIDFSTSFLIFIGMMFWYHIIPTSNILFLPIFIILCFMFALAVGLWLSALNVFFRDISYVLPFLLQTAQFISPVGYSSSVVSEKWKWLYSLNPMVGVIDGFRWSVLGTFSPNWNNIIISSISIFILFIGGLFFFKRMEKIFADII